MCGYVWVCVGGGGEGASAAACMVCSLMQAVGFPISCTSFCVWLLCATCKACTCCHCVITPLSCTCTPCAKAACSSSPHDATRLLPGLFVANGNSNSRWGGLAESSGERTLRAQLASSSATQFKQALTIARQAGLRTGSSEEQKTAIKRAAGLGGAAGLTAEALAAAGLPSYYDSRCVGVRQGHGTALGSCRSCRRR